MVNEKRLIDANALLDKLIKTSRYFDVKFDIEEAPTVDALEVVHARWELRPHQYRTFYPEYHCSNCGGWKHKLAYEHENMNFCPNCGAKMDGDGNG